MIDLNRKSSFCFFSKVLWYHCRSYRGASHAIIAPERSICRQTINDAFSREWNDYGGRSHALSPHAIWSGFSPQTRNGRGPSPEPWIVKGPKWPLGDCPLRVDLASKRRSCEFGSLSFPWYSHVWEECYCGTRFSFFPGKNEQLGD